MYVRFGKRAFDVAVATAALVILSPVLITIGVCVRVQMGSPIVFRQRRGGRHGAPFDVLKFRTMSDERDETGELLADDQRLTRFGQLLRRSSLDELPELLNIVRGQMSLVGPRPFIFEYLRYYTPEEARRHDVRPGLTGLAQTRGRNAIGWSERLQHDVEYLHLVSLRTDLAILAETVRITFSGAGINASESVTSSRLDDERRGAVPTITP